MISNTSGIPLYEQITQQTKNQILSGNLKEGELLPSIRQLAKDLSVSIITTKRAYEELEAQGFIITIGGKGSFVSPQNPELLRDMHLQEIEQYMERAVRSAKNIDVSLAQLQEILAIIFDDEGMA